MDEKTKLYMELVDIFTETLSLAKQRGPTKKALGLGHRLSSVSLKLIVLAPHEVVTSYLAWRSLAISENPNAEEVLKKFAEIIVAMRVDMVGDSTFCSIDDVFDALA